MNLIETLRTEARAAPESGIVELANHGRDREGLIPLWVGEGDMPTPAFITDAATAALAGGETFYTRQKGIPELRQALSRYYQRHFGKQFREEEFIVTGSGMHAIQLALAALAGKGKEVISLSPAWPNFAAAAEVAGARAVPVVLDHSDNGWSCDVDRIGAAVTERTRAIFINTPSNPTGWIMPREQMIAVRDFARERGIWIVSDEVYSHFTYDGKLAPSFLEITEPTDRLIVTNTFSKNWCMTGWRVGWLVYPEGMSTIFDNLSQYNTTSVSTFSQHAAVAALDQGDDFIKSLVERSAKGREIICSTLDRLPNVRVFWPEGTFYFFFSVHGMNSGYEMARRILKQAGVGVAPGSAFGQGGEAFLRVCFAVDPALIEEGARRLETFLRDQ